MLLACFSKTYNLCMSVAIKKIQLYIQLIAVLPVRAISLLQSIYIFCSIIFSFLRNKALHMYTCFSCNIASVEKRKNNSEITACLKKSSELKASSRKRGNFIFVSGGQSTQEKTSWQHPTYFYILDIGNTREWLLENPSAKIALRMSRCTFSAEQQHSTLMHIQGPFGEFFSRKSNNVDGGSAGGRPKAKQTSKLLPLLYM